jgi:hypothetical protein
MNEIEHLRQPIEALHDRIAAHKARKSTTGQKRCPVREGADTDAINIAFVLNLEVQNPLFPAEFLRALIWG